MIDAAHDSLCQALRLDDQDAWAFFLRAACHLISGRRQDARRDLFSACRVKNDREARAAAAGLLALLDIKENRGAGPWQATINTSHPPDAALLALAALLRRQCGATSAAVATLTRALALGPDRYLFAARAELFAAMGRTSEALADASAALRRETDSQTLLLRGRLLLEKGDAFRAGVDAVSAFSLGAADGEHLAMSAAKSLSETGRSKQSIAILGALMAAARKSGRALITKTPLDSLKTAARKPREALTPQTPPAPARQPVKALSARTAPLHFPPRILLLAARGQSAAALKLARSASRHAAASSGCAETCLALRLALAGGDFHASEKLADRLMDKTRDNSFLRILYTPFHLWEPVPGQTAPPPPEVRRLLLTRLDSWLRGRPRSIWARYLEGIFFPQRRSDLLAGPFMAPPKPKYAWSGFQVGQWFLERREFTEALPRLAAAAAFCKPIFWRSLGFMAEAELCLGRQSAAFRAIDQARAAALEYERPDAEAWRAELLLWIGDYISAKKILKAAAPLSRYGWTWLGGAWVKIGRPDRALEPLNSALKANAHDCEARLWLSEALLRLGRSAEAWREAQKAYRHNTNTSLDFAIVLSAAAAYAHGAPAKGRALFNELPAMFVSRAMSAARLATISQDEERRHILDVILALSRGDRRGGYVSEIWLHPKHS